MTELLLYGLEYECHRKAKQKKGNKVMKKRKRFGVVIAAAAAAAGVFWLCFGEKIKIISTSLNSFKDENLAHTFQHTPQIQPVKKISRGGEAFQFLKEDNAKLAEGFHFKDTFYSAEKFM